MAYAPPPGSDPAFDTNWAAVWAAVNEHTNPEGLIESDARELYAQRMTQWQGKTYTGAPGTPPDMSKPEAEPAEPRVLIVPVRPASPYWWDKPDDAEFLDHHILTRRALGTAYVGGLVITGPAGAGKTASVAQAVHRINERQETSLRLTKMDCATTTDPQKWFGRREVDKNGTRYEKSDFIIAVERGDVILLDDMSRMHPTIANGIFPALDHSQSIHLSDLNVTIAVHPETVFIATMNEGAQFGGTHRLDWAWRERFPFTIERGFPDPAEEEVRVLTSHTGVDEDGASNLVDIALQARSMYATGDLRFPLSTRTLVAAAWLVASGYDERTALSYTAEAMYDGDANGLAGESSDRVKFSKIMEGKFGFGG